MQVLSGIWDHLADDLQQAIVRAAQNHDQLRTKLLLGVISDISNDPAAELLSQVEQDTQIELKHVGKFPVEGNVSPQFDRFSPCVKESLNFFRVHHMRNITPARLALRLVQIGSGSTVRQLETDGVLAELQEGLQSIVEDG